MKIFVNIIFFILMSASVADAQSSMREVWIDMPDSVVAYLNKNNRSEMVEFYQMKVKASSKNLLEGESAIDTLTEDYIRVVLNEKTTMQLKCLQKGASYIICVVKTFVAPEPESEISFFNASWQPLGGSFGLPSSGDADALLKDFSTRPDTISLDRQEELASMLDPVMFSAELSVSEPAIILRLSYPMLVDEDKQNLNAVFKPRKFKWNGQTFIEC